MISNIQVYNKAIAVIVVGVIVSVAAHFGFKLDTELQLALTTLVTALAVWAVPNKR